jgi:hypothetical protein
MQAVRKNRYIILAKDFETGTLLIHEYTEAHCCGGPVGDF